MVVARSSSLRSERHDFYSKSLANVVNERVVIAMVGLPARGKSFMSKALVRYCNFLGVACKIFNAGAKRRDRGNAGADAAFFDASNKETQKLKDELAMETLDDLLAWLASETGLICGIFDATNTTRARRCAVAQRCAEASPPVTLIFLESICNDPEILQNNYSMKLSNQDYLGKEAEYAFQDFLHRVAAYEKVYEEIDDDEGASFQELTSLPMRYIQCIDAGKKLVISQVDGDSVLCKWIVQLITSIHLTPRKLSIVLAGESINDCEGVRGGDSELSDHGMRYAKAVTEIVKQRAGDGKPAPLVLAGTLRRYEQMAEMLHELSERMIPLKPLNELCFGSLEGLDAGLLRISFPEEYAAREADKLHYRYPGVGGQSYADVIMQIQPILMSIEASRRDNIIICDVALARVLLGYFEAKPIHEIPEIRVAPGIIELTRTHSGFTRTDVCVETGNAHEAD